jgi:hypothetical protein
VTGASPVPVSDWLPGAWVPLSRWAEAATARRASWVLIPPTFPHVGGNRRRPPSRLTLGRWKPAGQSTQYRRATPGASEDTVLITQRSQVQILSPRRTREAIAPAVAFSLARSDHGHAHPCPCDTRWRAGHHASEMTEDRGAPDFLHVGGSADAIDLCLEPNAAPEPAKLSKDPIPFPEVVDIGDDCDVASRTGADGGDPWLGVRASSPPFEPVRCGMLVTVRHGGLPGVRDEASVVAMAHRRYRAPWWFRVPRGA